MRRLRYSLPLGGLDSGALKLSAIVRTEGETRIAALHLGPGGAVARHPAAVRQLFLVVEGSGWVSGREEVEEPIAAGEGVFWNAEEEHGASTETGLRAIVIEADSMDVPARAD